MWLLLTNTSITVRTYVPVAVARASGTYWWENSFWREERSLGGKRKSGENGGKGYYPDSGLPDFPRIRIDGRWRLHFFFLHSATMDHGPWTTRGTPHSSRERDLKCKRESNNRLLHLPSIATHRWHLPSHPSRVTIDHHDHDDDVAWAMRWRWQLTGERSDLMNDAPLEHNADSPPLLQASSSIHRCTVAYLLNCNDNTSCLVIKPRHPKKSSIPFYKQY